MVPKVITFRSVAKLTCHLVCHFFISVFLAKVSNEFVQSDFWVHCVQSVRTQIRTQASQIPYLLLREDEVVTIEIFHNDWAYGTKMARRGPRQSPAVPDTGLEIRRRL